MRVAARRWTEKAGLELKGSFEEDLEKAPTSTIRLFMALWYLLGSVVPAGWLTLGLPTVWRLSRPYRETAGQLARAILVAAQQGLRPHPSSNCLVARQHRWMLTVAASTLSPRVRGRYVEEWAGEVAAIPTRKGRTRFCMSILASSRCSRLRVDKLRGHVDNCRARYGTPQATDGVLLHAYSSRERRRLFDHVSGGPGTLVMSRLRRYPARARAMLWRRSSSPAGLPAALS